MTKRNSKLFLLLIWIGLIIVASIVDFGALPVAVKDTIQFKKGYIGHFGAYFVASYLIWASFKYVGVLMISLNSMVLFLGIFIEYAQKYLPSRSFNKVDIYMNLSGVVCFNLILLFFYFSKKLMKPSN